MIAQVIVDVVHSNVDRPFSYLIPEGMPVEQGSRVSVPLGKRRVDGFVVSLLEEDQLPADVPLQKLRPIAAVLDDYPALPGSPARRPKSFRRTKAALPEKRRKAFEKPFEKVKKTSCQTRAFCVNCQAPGRSVLPVCRARCFCFGSALLRAAVFHGCSFLPKATSMGERTIFSKGGY